MEKTYPCSITLSCSDKIGENEDCNCVLYVCMLQLLHNSLIAVIRENHSYCHNHFHVENVVLNLAALQVDIFT